MKKFALVALLLGIGNCCLAEDPTGLAKHFVMVRGTSEPPGVSQFFPAVAIESDGKNTILATVSFGGELFPIGPKGKDVDRFHIVDSEESVALLACDEKLGVSLFRVSSFVPPWPAYRVYAGELKANDKLQWLQLDKRAFTGDLSKFTTVKTVGASLPYRTPQGQRVVVNDTIVFEGKAPGQPGTFLLSDGKLAALYLNNDASGKLVRHALTASSFMSGVSTLIAKTKAGRPAR